MPYLEGLLRRADETGAGTEHTGYVLEIEVDASAIEGVGDFVGDPVAITGDVEIVDYPERGKVMIFRATSAAAIEEESDEDDY